MLWRIKVEKKDADFLKGTTAHHKAKRKEVIVYVKREKDSLGSNLTIITASDPRQRNERMIDTTDKSANTIRRKDTGSKSKDKNSKQSKNSKRKERSKGHGSGHNEVG